MRIMTIVSTAYLFAGLIALTTAATASELAAYAPRANATPVCTGAVYHPYGHPWFPYYAYRQAVRFSYVPTAPPATICRAPTYHYGWQFYGAPYYLYPRPPLGCPGYAGFSGCDPNAYRAIVPPPIPTPSELPGYAQSSTPAAEQLPAPPSRVSLPAEPIPTPSGTPAPK